MKTTLLLLLTSVSFYAISQSCNSDEIFAVEDANAVCFEVVSNVRNIYTNNYPDHTDTYSSGFTLASSDASYSMCAYPEEASAFTPLYEATETTKGCTYTYAFGVGINGVKYDPSSADYFVNTSTGANNIEWHVEARYKFNGSFGNNGGHLNPFGEYHYHSSPGDYYADNLGIDGTKHSSIVGYAADGFPMYYKYVYSDPEDATSSITELSSGYSLKSGTRPGDGVSAPDGSYSGLYYEDYDYSSTGTELDECNGRWGVTPDFPYGTYYYVITDNYPYIPRCFKGIYVDDTFRVGPDNACPASSASSKCAAEVKGCMDPFSTNYNPDANVDDGSCTYSTSCTTSITTSQTNVTCFGGATGSISLTTSGFGNSPTYSWSNGATTSSITGLTAGTYTVTVTGNSCSDQKSVTITEGTEITVSATRTNASCGSADGTITVTASGGSGSLLYSKDNGVTFQTSNLFSNLASNRYRIVVKDGNECTATTAINVRQNGAPDDPTVTGTTSYCSGDAITALTVAGTGGTYTWYSDESLTTELATGDVYTPTLTSGSATYYVTETKSGCSSNAASITVTINPKPTITITASKTSVCEGESVTLQGSGAATYVWNEGVSDGVSFIPTATKTYMVTGADENGCTAQAEVTITVESLEVSVTIGANELTSDVEADSYQWINCETGEQIENAISKTYTPTEAGSYSVRAKKGACTRQSDCADFVILGLADRISLEVFPNPTNDFLTIRTDGENTVRLELVDLSGRVIESKMNNDSSTDFDLCGLQNGIYMVHVTLGSSSEWIRIIKN